MTHELQRPVDVIVGGQYGSEGKGQIAFHLARSYDVLMRVGGPNAGHIVPTTPPYTHRLLPSGTLANPDARLLIGPGATLGLEVLLREIDECRVNPGRLLIDEQAMVIEHEDLAAESALVANIASTGKGGGAAAARRILGRSGAVDPAVRLARDVPALERFVSSTSDALGDAYARGSRILLEGTQGTFLSLFHGFYPWVTSRDTSSAGTIAEAGIGPRRVGRVILVVRTYPIRVSNAPHGSSGPMFREVDWATVAHRSGLDASELCAAEKGSVSGTPRRVGEFDWDLLKRAVDLNSATEIALTFADYLDASNRGARMFDDLSPATVDFITRVETVAGVPVTLVSTGPLANSVIART